VTMTWLALHGSKVALLPFHLSGASRGFAGVMQSALQVALWSTRHCVVSYRGSMGAAHSPGSTSQGDSPIYGSTSLARVDD
jgi:hypothetical protein